MEAILRTIGATLSSKLGFVVQVLNKLPQFKKVAVGLVLIVTLLNFKNWPLVWHVSDDYDAGTAWVLRAGILQT